MTGVLFLFWPDKILEKPVFQAFARLASFFNIDEMHNAPSTIFRIERHKLSSCVPKHDFGRNLAMNSNNSEVHQDHIILTEYIDRGTPLRPEFFVRVFPKLMVSKKIFDFHHANKKTLQILMTPVIYY